MFKHCTLLPKIFLIFLVFLGCIFGCAVNRGTIYVKDGKEYGRNPGIWRDRWWNYYQRGYSYAEGGFWPDAVADFQAAIRQRPQDQWQARKYGMHFIDYFPHRELGIVLFHQKRYAEAVGELEMSLKTAVTAKAEFYLDLSRKALILSRGSDSRSPEISIKEPDPGLLTNKTSLRVSGRAYDDHFIKEVRINDTPVRIDLAAPEIAYDTKVVLKNGLNTITITAVDIVGNISRLQRIVIVDRLGPVISVDEPTPVDSNTSGKIQLKGYVSDDTNLASIRFNGLEILDRMVSEFILNRSIERGPRTDRITIQASDLAGNQTTAEIPLSGSRALGGSSILLAGLQVALSDAAPDPGMSLIRRDKIPPEINLKDWSERQSVYLKEAYLEGSASDNEIVDAVLVNGKSILRHPGKNVYFNQIVGLEEGQNLFHFKAQDQVGNLGTKSIGIQRNIQDIQKNSSRMELEMLPFERKGDGGEFEGLLEERLLEALKKDGRFKMKWELGIRSGKIDHSTAAVRVKNKMDADYVIVGSVEEKKGSKGKQGSMEIYAQIIETNTLQVLTIQNVYGVDIDRDTLDILCRGLVIKLHDALPVSEGIVLRFAEKKVFLNIGMESRIKEGMRCILYKDGKPLVDPVTKNSLGAPVEELARARILSVHEGYCEAEIEEVLADGVATARKAIMQ